MKIILVGGGSGGHILPLIAVQKRLELHHHGNEYVVITDKISEEIKSQFLPKTKFLTIKTGKFRRFAHWKWWQYFYPARYKFYFFNFVDSFKIFVGLVQSLKILTLENPNVIFAKGGYVSLPVGLAARFLSKSLVLHDSDTRPGIANRLIAPTATYIASGFPSADKRHIFTGVPIRSEFHKVTKHQARKHLNISDREKVLLITGGSLGARRINQIVKHDLDKLTKHFLVIHIGGETDYKQLRSDTQDLNNYRLFDFVGADYPTMVLAADIVVGRAGATTIAEFAAAAKPSVFIPNLYLTDQVSNSKWLKSKNAALIMDESDLQDNPGKLYKELLGLSQNGSEKEMLSQAISKLAKKTAADEVAKLIIKAAR